MNAKPAKVQTMAILVLINGVVNIAWGGVLGILIIAGTLGIGLLCAPILILPVVLGVFEIVYGINLMAEPPKVKELSMPLAILEICNILFLNIYGVVVGILSLVFMNEPEVKGYFADLESASTEV